MTFSYQSSSGSYLPTGATASDAGIGVIHDVVFNHTAEGGHNGPMINFKGFMNEIFYHLDPHSRSTYRDYTGCGNSVNCNHPLVTQFIVHCLGYWVEEMHVDGFRFDLASYNGEHNEANGEDDRDGCDNNFSWNCGAEGETDNPDVLAFRRRQAKNLMSILLLSQGMPMILLWFNHGAQYLAFTLAGLSDDEEDLHVILNMSERTVEAPLPVIPGRLWRLALDTSRTGPDDILPSKRQKAFEGSTCPITRRTVAVFEARE